ncbi:SRPBCC domain-containing protein [bacterium SCSIO 12827]|nr:SRPBCC domain-containing protein [bacterium SCSIO 12827]
MTSQIKTASTDADALIVTRRFAAPRALVFRMFTEPRHVVRWLGCAPESDVTFRNDLRVGGEFVSEGRMPDGTVNRVWGVYREISEPDRLVFTWSWEAGGFKGADTLVTVALAEQDGGTDLTLRHEAFTDDEARDLHGQGWGMCFDKIATLLAAG